MSSLAPSDQELADLRRMAAETVAAQRELAQLRQLHAQREEQHEQELFVLRTEVELLTRELADCEQRLASYRRLHEQGQRQAATLRQQNLACLAAIEMLRRGSKGYQQLLAAYQRHVNQAVGDGHAAATRET